MVLGLGRRRDIENHKLNTKNFQMSQLVLKSKLDREVRASSELSKIAVLTSMLKYPRST